MEMDPEFLERQKFEVIKQTLPYVDGGLHRDAQVQTY